jgi:beta-lactamase superfamily II metal-dependent hydrolase
VTDEVPSNFRIDCIDVGHGSSVVLTNGTHTTMIDSGPGGPILEYLRGEGITEVDTVIVSHADKDHIAGLIAMLDAGFRVNHIVINSDAAKKTAQWVSLNYSLDELLRAGHVATITNAVEGLQIETAVASITIDVLAPRHRLAALGAGNVDREKNPIKTNTMSVVAMIRVSGRPLLLFTGDIDAVGCQHMFDTGVDLQADYLVLPHHGGWMGTPAKTKGAIEQLCELVNPKQIFISNGRGGTYHNPKPIVIEAVRRMLPMAQLACAQLSQKCSAVVAAPGGKPASPFSQGNLLGHSCAGSIRLTADDGINVMRNTASHDAYVSAVAPTALCRTVLTPS